MSEAVIVIPCYNEAERLDTRAFRQFVTAHPGVRFMFVNDGSADRTGDVVASLEHGDPDAFEAITLERNSGKGEAVRRGIVEALKSNAKFVGYWDADLSTPLDEIPRFVTTLQERSDLIAVVGSRIRSLGRRVERRATRHYLGRVFATLAALVLGLGVYDTQCGAKLFRASNEVKDTFASPFRSRWVFDVELLARLADRCRASGGQDPSRAILELPLEAWRDVAGSKLRLRHAFRALLDLWIIRRRRRTDRSQG